MKKQFLALFCACVAMAGLALSPLAEEPRPVVYAWFPEDIGNWKTGSIPWDAITHLSFRLVEIGADGSVRAPYGKPPREFVKLAHQYGVKVTALTWVRDGKTSDAYLAHEAKTVAANLLAFVRENDLDGICIHDEYWREVNHYTGGTNRMSINDFLRTLRETFRQARPDYHIALAAPPVISRKDRFALAWLDWKSIAKEVDVIIPMLSTANPPRIGWTTNPTPIAGGGQNTNMVPRDMTTLMADYVTALGGQKEKLVLGIPSLSLGGYEFKCKTDQPLSPILAEGVRLSLADMEARAAKAGKRWHEKQQSAWYAFAEGNHFIQGWYDDERAWQAKLQWIREQGYGGVGVWTLNGVNDPTKMGELLRNFRGAKSPPSK